MRVGKRHPLLRFPGCGDDRAPVVLRIGTFVELPHPVSRISPRAALAVPGPRSGPDLRKQKNQS
jgi:hypothetical protein